MNAGFLKLINLKEFKMKINKRNYYPLATGTLRQSYKQTGELIRQKLIKFQFLEEKEPIDESIYI